MNKKAKNIRFTTPPAIFAWPHLNEPTYGSELYRKDKPYYDVALRFNPADTQLSWIEGKEQMSGGWKAFMERLQELADEQYEDAVMRMSVDKDEIERIQLVRPVLDDNKQETGELMLTCKCPAQHQTKSGELVDNRPHIFDMHGKPVEEKVGGGTLGRVRIEPYTWTRGKKVGLYLTLQAVKVINLVEFSDDSTAEGLGFNMEEDADMAGMY